MEKVITNVKEELSASQTKLQVQDSNFDSKSQISFGGFKNKEDDSSEHSIRTSNFVKNGSSVDPDSI